MRLSPRLLLALTALFAGCSGTPVPSQSSSCLGGKCDNPGATAQDKCIDRCGDDDDDCLLECFEETSLEHCEARREDAMAPNHFTRTHVRWACQDVDGVSDENGADRGQEYCEYFAIAELPPRNSNGVNNKIAMVGKGVGRDPVTGLHVTNNNNRLDLSLSSRQRTELEAMPGSEVVGKCVFTSWHNDTPGPLAVCEDGDECPEILGHSLDATHDVGRFSFSGTPIEVEEPLYRMVFEVNSNRAAADLVAQCMASPDLDEFLAPEVQIDHFTRGCMMMSPVGHTGLGTEWRRSDSSVCTAAMRMFECGCGVDTDRDGSRDVFEAEEIANVLVPEQPEIDDNGNEVVRLRGFPLGTWKDAEKLPHRCRYVDDKERTVVECDITASNLLNEKDDLKGFCGREYGPNVVAHVPIPDGFVVCGGGDPGDEFTEDCGFKPWIVGNEEAEGIENCDHDACEIGASLSPTCGSCEQKVCDADPFCCEVAWNRFCTDKVEDLCNTSCDDQCADQHDVCEEGEALDPTCSSCAKDVCEDDPFCCVFGWNQFCVAKVESTCGQTCD